MMRGPPCEPNTRNTRPSRSATVGAIEDNGRLSGAMALASPCIRRNWFDSPGLTVKSSISSFSRNPVSPATTPAPKLPLSV